MIDGAYPGFTVATTPPGVSVITLTEPERLNGLSQGMKRDLQEIFTQAQLDDDTRVVVVTGSGRAFCAGDDIFGLDDPARQQPALVPPRPAFRRAGVNQYALLKAYSQDLVRAVRGLDKLTIAAVNGVAIQLGLSIALACDLRIAAPEARLGSATLRFAFLPDEGGHWLLVQHLGIARALEFVMRNRIVTAAEALELGLVNEVVPADALLDRTMALATELAEGPQAAMRMLKRSMYNAAQQTFEQAADDIAARTAVTDHLPDTREGVIAYRERRPPRFNAWLDEPLDGGRPPDWFGR